LETRFVVLVSVLIRGGFVLADITAHDNIGSSFSEPGHRRVNTFIVKAHSVHERLVFGKAEQPGFWSAGLRGCRERSDLYKSKSEICQPINKFSVLVKTRGEADGIFEGKTEQVPFEALVADSE